MIPHFTSYFRDRWHPRPAQPSKHAAGRVKSREWHKRNDERVARRRAMAEKSRKAQRRVH